MTAEPCRALPGSWRILATTFPLWLSGKRSDPMITYTVLPGDPLALRDDVSWTTRRGRRRHLIGIDRYRPGPDRFVWRGAGMLRPLTSVWTVHHLSDDGTIAVLAFGRSLFTPAGLDVLGRAPERVGLGRAPERVGLGRAPGLLGRPSAGELRLTADQYAGLTWLGEAGRRPG
ncbi:hypothetical protein ACFFWC_09365 [Plantactinospora siamensis]|uniref:Uncharacterized protein n=1 Tax=Plantactinospora siamensis TaxID=555372 RepID=A0ABV6P5D5_9ACTN